MDDPEKKKDVEARNAEVNAPIEKTDDAANRSETVESELRAERGDYGQQEETPDLPDTGGFVIANARRLGFKVKLNVAIRRAIAVLERGASHEAGKNVDAIRREFLELERGRAVGSLERILPAALLAKDYRAFLICYIALAREAQKFRRDV